MIRDKKSDSEMITLQYIMPIDAAIIMIIRLCTECVLWADDNKISSER